MQKPFSTQPELFLTSDDLEHPSLQGLDGAEAVLDWQKLEQIMAGTDVLAWLKSQGKGYQSRMNAILRREMLSTRK